MEVESHRIGGQTGAVFLSYASQDADAAQRICAALRAGGIEVWFDKSELRGGDAWDRSIRQQIHDCALFVPIISQHTHERLEGYFRREWRLAVERAGDMAENKAFFVPVVVDDTTEQDPSVPEKFRELQWTRLPAGETSPAFVERIQRLLSGKASTLIRAPPGAAAVAVREQTSASWGSKRAPLVAAALPIAGALAYLATERPWMPKHPAPATTAPASAAPASFNPPPHSIVVLPFVNLSGDKEQEYFSDGLTEELLDSLAKINELQVVARTSAFSFKGQNTDTGTIARKLNVGAILEGSVRRSGRTVRISARLINAVTGFQLWSKSFDRDMKDVLKLQTEIATAVAGALKVSLLGDISQKIELGGTRNPAAFDAYLRASKAFLSRRGTKDIPDAIAAYSEAIRLDPSYALAFVYRSFALTTYAAEAGIRDDFQNAEADARRAIALAPDLAEGHAALGYALETGPLDFARAREAYDRAIALAPGNAQVLRATSTFIAYTGHFDAAITSARRAVILDPLDRRSHSILGRVLYAARRYAEAATAHADAIRVNPGFTSAYAERGLALNGLGELESARASCETKRDAAVSQVCLAVVYSKLGRHADAEAELAKLKAAQGDASAYDYATIYAQWGDHGKALKWLDTAMHLRDSALELLKTDPLMDPLRSEPHFQAVMRELKFPD